MLGKQKTVLFMLIPMELVMENQGQMVFGKRLLMVLLAV